jgi:hypothetical protein
MQNGVFFKKYPLKLRALKCMGRGCLGWNFVKLLLRNNFLEEKRNTLIQKAFCTFSISTVFWWAHMGCEVSTFV